MTNQQCCPCPEEVNVPITGITVPFCGFGVNIDASKLPKCECGLTREDVLAMIEASRYTLCEFYYFRNPLLRPGFEKAEGALLENAAILYPEAWAYLQTPEGQALCKTEEEWQAMTQAVWHTNADGTEIGWDGIGGAPFYAPNLETGALRLPDLRGMYAEAAGFDGLEVGGVHGDAMRRTLGTIGMGALGFGSGPNPIDDGYREDEVDGPFRAYKHMGTTNMGGNSSWSVRIDTQLTMPTGNANKPRAFGVLPCVYLGIAK